MSDHSLAWNLLGEATHLLTLSIIAYLKTFLLLIEVLCAHLTLWARTSCMQIENNLKVLIMTKVFERSLFCEPCQDMRPF